MVKSVGTQLARLVDQIGRKGGVENPDRRNNGPFLFEIFVWQELARYAESKLKLAWKTAQAKDGICDPDDDLRAGASGEAILCRSTHFALQISVQDPKQNFDRDAFIAAVAKKYRLDPVRLTQMAEDTVKDTKASLSKKVIELAAQTEEA